jgi:uncharacterized membrane protein
MVLEMRAPHDTGPGLSEAAAPGVSQLRSEASSTLASTGTTIIICWHTARHVTGRDSVGQLHLLFWLSLVPFVTAWMGENHFEQQPVALYGVVMMMSGVAYYILTTTLIRHHGPESGLRAAVGNDFKGLISVADVRDRDHGVVCHHWVSLAIYVAVTLMWLVPTAHRENARARELISTTAYSVGVRRGSGRTARGRFVGA